MRFMCSYTCMVREDMQVVGVSDRDTASRRNWRLRTRCGDPYWEQPKEKEEFEWFLNRGSPTVFVITKPIRQSEVLRGHNFERLQSQSNVTSG